MTSRVAAYEESDCVVDVGLADAGAAGVYEPGGWPWGPGAACPALPPICEYAMKLPNVPWKKNAAIGGAVRISVVRINPMPPCCIA